MPSAACGHLAAQRRALLISAIVPLLFAGCATTGEDAGSAADDQKCRELLVKREEEQKQEESSRGQDAELRQRSEQQQSPARQIAGIMLIPVVVVGLPVIIAGEAVGAAKEAFAMPFTELMARAGIDPGTPEVRKRKAEIESAAAFLASCVEVLRTEREFGPEDSRMIGPLIRFGDAYWTFKVPQADIVYQRVVAIAEQNNVDNVEFDRWVEKSYGLRVHVHRNPSRFSWRYGCPSLTNGPKAKHGEQSIHPSGVPYICDDGIWRLAP